MSLNILTIFYYKKFISFPLLVLLLVSNPNFAETLITKSNILRKSNECFKDHKNQECEKLILKMERFQLVEFEQNRFKCQSSILGLQTELIGAYFFNSIPRWSKGIMIPYVIKNC